MIVAVFQAHFRLRLGLSFSILFVKGVLVSPIKWWRNVYLNKRSARHNDSRHRVFQEDYCIDRKDGSFTEIFPSELLVFWKELCRKNWENKMYLENIVCWNYLLEHWDLIRPNPTNSRGRPLKSETDTLRLYYKKDNDLSIKSPQNTWRSHKQFTAISHTNRTFRAINRSSRQPMALTPYSKHLPFHRIIAIKKHLNTLCSPPSLSLVGFKRWLSTLTFFIVSYFA